MVLAYLTPGKAIAVSQVVHRLRRKYCNSSLLNAQRSQTAHSRSTGSIRSLSRTRVPGHDDLAANLPSGYDVPYSRLSRCNIQIGVAITQIITLYRELSINKNVDGGGCRIMPWLQDN